MAFALIFLGRSPFALAFTAPEILQRLAAGYRQVPCLRVQLTMVTPDGEARDLALEYSGERFRLESSESIVLGDGKSLYRIFPQLEQVVREPLTPESSVWLPHLLLQRTDSLFQVDSLVRSGDTLLFQLKFRREALFLRAQLCSVKDRVVKLFLFDTDGNPLQILFREEKRDSLACQEERFDPTPWLNRYEVLDLGD
jgi:hypothetical protein